jgi:gamma-glutamyl:cysteine ligase YbdK (ATP-grasp superfamily)
VSWLLDVVPPDYRLHGVLVRHPVALAALASHHLNACVEGARQGYRSARAELGKDLPPSGLAAVLAAYQSEGRRLVATAKAVELVSRALHGETFVPQLAG